MKITKNRFLISAMIAAGIFAVAVTHRNDDSGVPEPFEASDVSFRSLDQLAGKNLVGVSPTDSQADNVSQPTVVTATEPEASIRVAQNPPEIELPSLPTAPAMQEQLTFADDLPLDISPLNDSLELESSPSTKEESEVQSYSYLPDETSDGESDPVSIAMNTVASETPTKADSASTVNEIPASGKWQSNKRNSKWKSNPFIGPGKNDTSATKPQLNTPQQMQAQIPELDFASTAAAPIEATVETALPVETAASTNDMDDQVAVTSGTLPGKRFVDPIPVAAQPSVQPNRQAMPQYEAPVVMGMSEAAAQKAAHHIEYGKSLARRNATQLATREFFSALRVLAQANDARIGNDSYTGALREGIIALREAQDFMIGDPQSGMGLNVGFVTEAHDTQLIGTTEARSMTAAQAHQKYLHYAGQQLGICGGQNVIAAEALFCLGKLNSISAQADPNPESSDLAKAQVFHRASLEADPQNFRSANELGVLLARSGELNEAEQLLKRSLITRPIPQAWGNLAKIHQRKGTARDMDLANKAHTEYQIAMQNEAIGLPVNTIQWMEPQEFVARSPALSPEVNRMAQSATSENQNAVVPATNVEAAEGRGKKTSIADRIKSVLPGSLRR
jgi:tetratricopeptide (TPR) repeat protein